MLAATVSVKLMNQVLARVKDVTTLPHVAMKLIRLGNDSTIGAAELVSMVQSDPATCARVLRCVNTAAYALRYRIDNLQRAVAHLGSRTVRNLAITAYVSTVFRQPLNKPPYSRTGLWRHSVAVAIMAKCIASRMKLGDPEEAFVTGLLHDIGIIMEDEHVHRHFLTVLDRLADGASLLDAEREVLGFTHQDLGQRVTENWDFPKSIINAIAYHHTPSFFHGEYTPSLDCVHLANVLCSSHQITSVGVNCLQGDPGVLDRTRITTHDLRALSEDLPRELEQNSVLLEPP